jgi:hypothetical protein
MDFNRTDRGDENLKLDRFFIDFMHLDHATKLPMKLASP